jgi:hypothetical protein
MVPATPRLLANVHQSMNTRYAVNRYVVAAQHKWPRAVHRRVTGSQSRLNTTNPAGPATMLRTVAPMSHIKPADTAASKAVPIRARTNRRVQCHAPVRRATTGRRRNNAAVATGAANRPASKKAESISFEERLQSGSGRLGNQHPAPAHRSPKPAPPDPRSKYRRSLRGVADTQGLPHRRRALHVVTHRAPRVPAATGERSDTGTMRGWRTIAPSFV